MMQRVAARCSILQCIAVCCSVLHLMSQASTMGANHDIGHQVIPHLHLKRQHIIVGVHEEEAFALHLLLLCVIHSQVSACM